MTSTLDIGHATPSTTLTVRADDAAAYARATHDDNPRYADGTIAPPMFGTVLGGRAVVMLYCAIFPDFPNVSMIHLVSDLHFHQPLVPGTQVVTWARTLGLTATPRGGLLHFVVHLTDEGGRPVLDWYSSVMLPERRDIRTGGELLPDARPPQSPRRGVLARRVVMLPGDQPQQYAAVSGDYQRLHFDDNVARAAGLEKAVVQGACTLAICAAIATDVAAGSDPTRLARVVGRFAHPVYPESRLVVEVSEPVEGTDPAVHSVRATRNGRPVVRGGRVDVRP